MNLKQLNVLLLGSAFHLIFFSFQTSVFVQQTVVNSLISRPDNQFHGNAYLSLCITYTIFALSNWLAPSIIALTGVKYGMFLGACTYVLYSASFLFPTTWLFYLAAALIGFGAAPLWTAQGAFLAKQSDATTSSRNAAIFWSMLQSSLLFGNLFVYFAFGAAQQNDGADQQGKQTIVNQTMSQLPAEQPQLMAAPQRDATISDRTRFIVYGVLTIVCALGTLVILLLRDGTRAELSGLNPANGAPNRSSSASINSQSQQSQGSSEQELNNNNNGMTALEQFLAAINLFKTTNMLLLSTAFLFTGQLLSFFTGVYGTAIGATSQFGENSKQYIGLAGIAIGVGEILGGTIFGLLGSRGLGNKLRRDSVFLLGFLVLICALSLTFVNLPRDSSLTKHNAQLMPIIEPRLWISMVASVLIGFGDACFNTQVYSLLMSVYSHNSVPAFALFKFTQSVGSAIAFLYSANLDLYFQIAILAFMSTIATFCFCLVEWRSSPSRLVDDNKEKGRRFAHAALDASVISALEKSESQQSILHRLT